MVGSTALVQANETLAHQRIQDTFQRFASVISSQGGTALEVRGDALVAEFSRASDAIEAALSFQTDNSAHLRNLVDEIKPVVRVGIAMGEVVVADETVTGEAVVLAQRLEQLAKPGGVCIQGTAQDTVPERLPYLFERHEAQVLKGISKPVQVYAVSRAADTPTAEPHVVAQSELASLELPEEPSIAVLPFANMSSDPEQEFFSDGMTEDIITALSKISALLVIARNSTFIYKGKAIDIKQVGREQGVRYVLEGSVRKIGKRVRVTAQLVDAITGRHHWAERYDRGLEDIFAIQDEITRKIVSALDVRLREGEQARFWSSGTESLEAWECVRLGSDLLNSYRADDIPEAMRLCHRAIELDPDYASAWSWLGWVHSHVSDDSSRSEEERAQALQLMKECAERAIECDPSCAEAYVSLGMYYLSLKDYSAAAESANRSIALAPNHAYSIAVSAAVLNKCDQVEIALERIRKAMRLSPIHPAWFLHILGQSSRLVGNTDAAIDAYEKLVERQPDSLIGHITLASCHGEMNRREEAEAAASEVLRLDPNFSAKRYVEALSYSDSRQTTRFEKGLRAAGLPE